jgi:hypothetical protein
MLPCNKTAVNRRIRELAMSRIQTHNYKFHLIRIGIQTSLSHFYASSHITAMKYKHSSPQRWDLSSRLHNADAFTDSIEIAKMFAGHEPKYFKLLQLCDVA